MNKKYFLSVSMLLLAATTACGGTKASSSVTSSINSSGTTSEVDPSSSSSKTPTTSYPPESISWEDENWGQMEVVKDNGYLYPCDEGKPFSNKVEMGITSSTTGDELSLFVDGQDMSKYRLEEDSVKTTFKFDYDLTHAPLTDGVEHCQNTVSLNGEKVDLLHTDATMPIVIDSTKFKDGENVMNIIIGYTYTYESFNTKNLKYKQGQGDDFRIGNLRLELGNGVVITPKKIVGNYCAKDFKSTVKRDLNVDQQELFWVGDGWNNGSDEYFANIENKHSEYIRPYALDVYFDWSPVKSCANYRLDTTKFDDGYHTVTARARNGGANGKIVLQNNVIFDNTSPKISANIEDDAVITSANLLKYTSSDALSGVAKNIVKIDDVLFTGKKYISLQDLNPGAHSLSVTSIDKAGNSACEIFNFNIEEKAASINYTIDKNNKIKADAGYEAAYTFTEYEKNELSVAPANDAGEGKTSNSAMVYDEFLITVENSKKDVYLTYDGETTQNEKVLIEAQNATTEAWEKVYVCKNGKTNFSVNPSKYVNQNGKMKVRARPYKVDEGIDRAFWVSDFQYLAKVDTKFTDLASYYSKATDYMAKEYSDKKVSYVFNTGDIVDNPPENGKNAENEWIHASEAWDAIDKVGLPYGTGAGNHDVGSSIDNNVYTYYSKYFGAGRNSTSNYYGGSLNNNESHYDLITIGDYDFIVLYLGYGKEVTEESISFANKVLKKFAHRNAIVATHAYLDNGGSYDPSTRAERIFNQIVKPNENVKMVFCGHTDGSEVMEKTIGDRKIYELLSCYQFVETQTDDTPIAQTKHVTNGYKCNGEGWMKELFFENGTMKAHTYSPILNQNEFSTSNGIKYKKNDYTIELNLAKKSHFIKSNSLVAYQAGAEKNDDISDGGTYSPIQKSGLVVFEDYDSDGANFNFVAF